MSLDQNSTDEMSERLSRRKGQSQPNTSEGTVVGSAWKPQRSGQGWRDLQSEQNKPRTARRDQVGRAAQWPTQGFLGLGFPVEGWVRKREGQRHSANTEGPLSTGAECRSEPGAGACPRGPTAGFRTLSARRGPTSSARVDASS